VWRHGAAIGAVLRVVGPPLVRLGTVEPSYPLTSLPECGGSYGRTSVPQTNPPHLSKQADPKVPFIGAIARLYWLLLGNAALSLIAIGIAQRGPAHTWITDAVFWTVVASLVLVRYLDIARFGGTTASGEPASAADWYRYAWRLLLVALAVWIVAHALRLGLELAQSSPLTSCQCYGGRYAELSTREAPRTS
jgi:hypothetical protein